MKTVHKFLKLSAVTACLMLMLSSCVMTNRMMREPNVWVEMDRDDFVLSDQVSASATSKRILGIDWQRLFKNKSAVVGGNSLAINVANLPVFGGGLSPVDVTSNYALYELMTANEGYDVIFYPQYEKKVSRPIIGLGFLYRKTEVKVTARLGRLTSEKEKSEED